jgi:hypothetical protein
MPDRIDEEQPTLSAVLIVLNEAHCIETCLRSIADLADEIVVLDAGSTDATATIARSFGAKVEVTDWPGFGPQKNRALARARGKWVLSIDADEHLTPELAESIRATITSAPIANGYFIRVLATWCGEPVRFGAWARQSPLRLFRRGRARFSDDLVHERVICEPPHATLEGIMIHDTVATEEEARAKALHYADLGAPSLAARGRGGLGLAFSHALWTFVRGFIIQGGFLDGRVGWKVASACARGTWLRYRIAGKQLTTGRLQRAAEVKSDALDVTHSRRSKPPPTNYLSVLKHMLPV